MRATVLHCPGDVRFEHVDDPKILKPTDAIINLGSRGIPAEQRRMSARYSAANG